VLRSLSLRTLLDWATFSRIALLIWDLPLNSWCVTCDVRREAAYFCLRLHACGRGWALDVLWWKERHCGQQRGCVPTGGWWWVIDVLCNYFAPTVIMYRSCVLLEWKFCHFCSNRADILNFQIRHSVFKCVNRSWILVLLLCRFYEALLLCCAASNNSEYRRKTPLSKPVLLCRKGKTSGI
jgi:hypothetical protein